VEFLARPVRRHLPLLLAALLSVLFLPATAVPAAATTAEAADRPALWAACGAAPTGRFDDVAGVHGTATDCLGWWGITQGVGDHHYDPRGTTQRGQMAAFLARTVTATGGELPTAAQGAFSDTAGTTHHEAIGQLAALGVMQGGTDGRFDPGGTVTRAQMATFLARLWEALTGAPLPEAASPFTDVAASIHADSIGRVADAGIAEGISSTAYAPDRAVTREQMATFLTRLLARLVEDGQLAYPPTDPVAIPARAPVHDAIIGTTCSTEGGDGLTRAGNPVRCGALWPDDEPIWQPRMDPVAVRAHARIQAWIDEQPPGQLDIPVHRHPDVPPAYGTAARDMLELGAPLLAAHDARFEAILVPLSESGRRYAWERVVDTLPPDTTAADRREVERSLQNLFDVSCGGGSRQGRTTLRLVEFLVEVFPVEPSATCGTPPTPTVVVESMAREWLGAILGISDRDGDEVPCWAGEASGWPLQRALFETLGLQDLDQRWSRWNVQLTTDPIEQHMLGLQRSERWTHDAAANQYCYLNGAGHMQGSLAHELLIDRYGMDAWLAWGEISSETSTVRPAFEAAFGLPLERFMEEADARLYEVLEIAR